MATFQKFDPHAFLSGNPQPSLAGLATLAGEEGEFKTAAAATKQEKTDSDDCSGSRNCHSDPAKLAKAAKVQAQSTPDAVLGIADCLECLAELYVELRAAYIEGALPWAFEHIPDLVQRFHDTEASIDRLASTGPAEAAFHSALAAHCGVWRELFARYRAHQERQAERQLQVAVGIGCGSGKLGTRDVARQKR